MKALNSLAHSLIISVVFLLSVHTLHAQTEEFHYGYGGISIKAGGKPDNVHLATGNVDDYNLSGYWFAWEHDAYDVRLLVASVFSVNSTVKWISNPALDVAPKWKAEYVKQLGTKVVVRESPLVFQGSKGFEIRANGERAGLTRVFSMKGQLIAATVLVDNAGDVDLYRRILDSIRPLTHVERTVAMIEEFSPPALSQERPKQHAVPDLTELGLVGAVRAVRDMTTTAGRPERAIVQEIQFDNDGFKTREVAFNQNFPDVITSWGWDSGKRVNIQSAVNYPPGEGPLGGRSTVVSGSLSIPGIGTFVNRGPKYGNRVETEFDSSNRPSVRRRFANIGDLILVDHFKYGGRMRETRTVDSSGGFMGAVRETLDVTNNVIESQTLSSDGKVFESTRFEYEFDPRGNWIVRRGFRKSVGGKTPVKPTSVVYRDIRYHDQLDQRRIA